MFLSKIIITGLMMLKYLCEEVKAWVFPPFIPDKINVAGTLYATLHIS